MFHLFCLFVSLPDRSYILIALFLLPLLDPPSVEGQEKEKRGKKQTRVRRETAINATLFVMSGAQSLV
jgi:hypothetical protein